MLENDPDAAFIAGADVAPVAEASVADATPPAEENKGANEAPVEAVAEEPAAEAEPAETVPEEPEATKDEAEGDKRRHPWWQKRIDTLGRGKAAAEERAAALEQQLVAVLQSIQGQQPVPDGEQPAGQPQPPKAAPAQPNMAADQIRAEAQRIVAEQEFNRTCNAIYEQGAKEFKSDWQDAVATLGQALPTGITRDLVEAATEAGDPHKLFYHLGKHPEIAQEIVELPPARMAVRLAKLATDLNKPAAPKPVSQAPAPVKPIGGGSTSVETDPEKMSTEQWMKWHDEQQEKRRRRA